MYSVTLNNKLAETIPKKVPPAVMGAGLPSSSVADFTSALTGLTALEQVPGISESAIAAGVRANKEANAEAYRTVFLVTIAFSGIALISSLLLPDVDKLFTNKVASTLHKGRKGKKGRKDEKRLRATEVQERSQAFVKSDKLDLHRGLCSISHP